MRSTLQQFILYITRLNRWLFYAASTLMAIIVPVMLYEVTSRYIFNSPTTWGMELAVLLFGPYFLLGGPYLIHIGGHVNLDVVRRRLNPKAGRYLDSFNYLIIVIFCCILISYSYPLAMQAYAYKETTFSAWNPPLWPYKFAVPISSTLLGLQAVAELLRLWLEPLDSNGETA